ncbi:unnamed protein product, partial [Sphacelaria rigidula]
SRLGGDFASCSSSASLFNVFPCCFSNNRLRAAAIQQGYALRRRGSVWIRVDRDACRESGRVHRYFTTDKIRTMFWQDILVRISGADSKNGQWVIRRWVRFLTGKGSGRYIISR